MKFLNTSVNFATYAPMFDGGMVANLSGKFGYITGYNGSNVPFFERYFDGGDTFRGFALAGIGPRDIVAPNNTGALGGTVRAIGSAQFRFPRWCRKAMASACPCSPISAPWAGWTRSAARVCTGAQYSGIGTCVKDNLAFRGSAGISVQWKSPFGPVQIDLGLPYAKTSYDRPRSSTSALPQDTKMKKTTLTLALRASPFRLRLSGAGRSPQAKIVVIDRAAIMQFSKVGQDIAKQMQAYANQAKNDLSAQGKALQAEGRTLQQQVAILAPDVKAEAAGRVPRQGRSAPGRRAAQG